MSTITRAVKSGAALFASAVIMIGLTGVQTAAAHTTMTATTGVNVRSGPSVQTDIIGGVYRGQTVTAISTSSGWTKINFVGRTAYVAAQYFTAGSRLPATSRVGSGVADITTTSVNLRKGPGPSYAMIKVIARGTRVTLTGRTAQGYAEIVNDGVKGWVGAQYLASAATALPRVTGFRYATANLAIRTTSGADAKIIATVPAGTALSITGVTQNGRAQIVHHNSVRWVTAIYLSATQPSGSTSSDVISETRPGEQGLQPNAIKVRRAALIAFPQITTIYGYRQDPIPDHPSGLALDLMIPNYTTASGKALGAAVAAWGQKNQATLGIEYIIWDQQIWSVRRAAEGWRFMADRGGDSANHKDHVHITVMR
ncbi:MAG TPA: SH3 domain-containing protein [Propionibacteriaceae bacterium]|nr:SH3 domain-containing protein [Propionibacteriaceae bacterium]